MTADFIRAYKTTVDFWAEDFKMTPLVAVDVKEVSAAGPVTQDNDVKVSAIIVGHPPVKPAPAMPAPSPDSPLRLQLQASCRAAANRRWGPSAAEDPGRNSRFGLR